MKIRTVSPLRPAFLPRLGKLFALLALATLSLQARADDATTLPDASWDDLPAWRGSNLLHRFHQSWQNKPFTQEDFQLLADFGFNFVRLPIDYRIYTASDDWLAFDESILANLDQAVAWCNELGIHLQINLHRIPGYTVATPAEATDLWTDPATQAAAAAHWAMFAERYAQLPNSHISFNLINEPTGAVTTEQYVNVVSILSEAIRAIDPDRLIIADGLNYGNDPVPELIPLQVAQSFHMYEPFHLTHHRAGWVPGSDSWATPAWPSNTVSSYLYAPAKGDLHSTLTIETQLPTSAQLRIKIGTVSTRSTLQIKADGQVVSERTFTPGPGDGEWQKVVYNETYDIYQNLYLLDTYATIPAETQKIEIKNSDGDWMTLFDFGITPEGSQTEHTLVPGNGSWGSIHETTVYYSPTTQLATDDGTGAEQLWKDRIEKWATFKKQGVGVMAGEWGVHNQTPHATTLAWTRDLLEALTAADIAWAQWDYYGSFGPFDSGRTDVQYEKHKGHQLDKDMMDILQEFALHKESFSSWAKRTYSQSPIPTQNWTPYDAPASAPLSNIECYAHAIDPFQPDPKSRPHIQTTSYPIVNYNLSPKTVGLAVDLYSSLDLKEWTPSQDPELSPPEFKRLAYTLTLAP